MVLFTCQFSKFLNALCAWHFQSFIFKECFKNNFLLSLLRFFSFQNVFTLYDRDRSGNLSGFELRNALNSAGYQLNNHILNILMHRYGKNGSIEFEDFILCVVKLKTMIGKCGNDFVIILTFLWSYSWEAAKKRLQ